EKRWEAAETSYAAAIQAGKELLATAFTDAGRRTEIAENIEMHNRLVQISLNLQSDPHYVRQSLVYAESGKARTFLDQMSQGDFPPPEELPATLVKQERDLLEEKRQLVIQLSASNLAHEAKTANQSAARPLRDLGQRHETIQTELRQVWEQMNHYPQAQEYVALRRGDSPEWDDLTGLVEKLGSQTALVEFYLLNDQIVVFALRAGWSQPHVYTVPISQEKLWYRYVQPYRDEVGYNRTAERQSHAEWRKLGTPLLEPLLDLLDDIRTVYFVPHGLLHLLPLHGMLVRGEAFIQHYAVAYAPSAGVLSRLLNDRQPRATNGQTLIMGYTPNVAERNLFVGEEAAIAQLYKGTPLMDEQANGELLRQNAPQADIIHLSCHGIFDSRDPLNSRVQLADGDFTARDWMKLRLHADLVTLSACQTGIADIRQGDEIAGLTHALLYAGANSALVTLWSVNAASTQEWMQDFYGAIHNSSGSAPLSKAQAFQQATLNLRAHYDDPYYWAPFILVGR
ncbi:MAG TPA: CHAT domain-containing protein, partial [Phototrophicaceae bacterium]|nr:CHAT domain-containing protein [Phototrophicaceae bacterium]